MKPLTHTNAVIFFDGVCVLCNSSIAWIIKIDKKKVLKFSPLQGAYAKSVLGLTAPESNDSLIFYRHSAQYEKGEAIIQILKSLGSFYRFLGYLLDLIPLFFLNFCYDFIANNRYRLFGKTDTCLLVDNENADRFIP